jgi:L-amino acid N-acyltransferase YncA
MLSHVSVLKETRREVGKKLFEDVCDKKSKQIVWWSLYALVHYYHRNELYLCEKKNGIKFKQLLEVHVSN